MGGRSYAAPFNLKLRTGSVTSFDQRNDFSESSSDGEGASISHASKAFFIFNQKGEVGPCTFRG